LGLKTQSVALSDSGVLTVGSADALFISPAIKETGSVNIKNIVPQGTASVFETGSTGAITTFADNSPAAVAIATVTNVGGQAQFDRTAHGFVVGDVLTHTAFTNGGYNGDFVVTIANANDYQVGLAFIASDTTGMAQNRRITVTTSTAHGLSNLTSVLIKNTVNNNGGFEILDASASVFDIKKVFVDTQAANYDTGSITNTESRVSATENPTIPDSMFSGESGVFFSSPVTVTIATIGIPVLIAGTTWSYNKLERAAGDPSNNGLLKTQRTKTGKVIVHFSATIERVGGGAQDIGVVVIINGVLTTAATFNPPRTVNTGKIQVSAARTFTLQENDTLQVAVVNFADTANILVTQADIDWDI